MLVNINFTPQFKSCRFLVMVTSVTAYVPMPKISVLLSLPDATKSNLADWVESLKLIPIVTVCVESGSKEAKLANSCIDIPGDNDLAPTFTSVNTSCPKFFKVN